MEMSKNKHSRDQNRSSSSKTNRNKGKKHRKQHSLSWTEAARAWAERTDGLAAEVSAAPPLQQVQDFHEAPPHPDLNNEAGTGMLCKRRGRRGGGGRRKGKKGGGKKKGRKGKGRKGKKKKKPKCKKFPLGDCRAPKRKEQRKTGRCPPKKKKRKIKDCPPDDDRGCKRTSSINGNWAENREYNLPSREMMQEPYMRMFEDEKEGQKRRCPKPDYTIAKDFEIKECPKKRNPSRICPGNLLRKKKRNRYRGRKGKNKRGNRRRRDTSSRRVSVPLSLQSDASATKESVHI